MFTITNNKINKIEKSIIIDFLKSIKNSLSNDFLNTHCCIASNKIAIIQLNYSLN